jgi:calcineurin-like phosphoesterase family protein
MTTFFTADTHFHHTNIIKYCDRPFSSIEEMDSELIKRWNSVVTDGDTVYHLGDFIFSRNNNIQDILFFMSRLQYNELILIKGNHDNGKLLKHYRNHLGIHVHDYLELKDMHTLPIVLSHYPFESWNRSFHGSIHLHGHTHGTIPIKQNRYDVGVDVWNYTPVTLEQILGK